MKKFELSHCPCCGSEAKLKLTKTINYYDNGYRVGNLAVWGVQIYCEECHVQSPEYKCTKDASTPEEEIISFLSIVIENWNYRPNAKKECSCVELTDPLEVLLLHGLSKRAFYRIRRFIKYKPNGLLREGMTVDYQVTVGDLIKLTDIELLRARGMGKKTMQDITDTLANVGLSLRGYN